MFRVKNISSVEPIPKATSATDKGTKMQKRICQILLLDKLSSTNPNPHDDKVRPQSRVIQRTEKSAEMICHSHTLNFLPANLFEVDVPPAARK